LVTQAIAADQAKEYERAYELYKRSLDYFMIGLKYITIPSVRNNIKPKVESYMKRAEDLKNMLYPVDGGPTVKKGSSGATATKDCKPDTLQEDDEKLQLRGALSSAIVSEKPNVKWDDVAGLGDSIFSVHSLIVYFICLGTIILNSPVLRVCFLIRVCQRGSKGSSYITN